jgi:GT2 family glycosyltransferase
MSRSVSVVVPGLDDREHFERALPPLLAERARCDALREILVVDDTGTGGLERWLASRFPEVASLALDENRGFAPATLAGVERASGELVFLMNPDVRVRPGFLAPLVAALEDDDVFAASPRVLLFGEETRIESSSALSWSDGRLEVEPRTPGADPAEPRATAFAIGGAMLVRRRDFLGRGGFDPLFAPFYWEDVDLCVSAWREGRRVVEVPRSIVEHHHRGTIGPRVPEELVQAAIEKNRRLLAWKHATSESECRDLVRAAWRDLVDATSTDRREELVHLCLALEELGEVARSRTALAGARRSLTEVLRASDPRP